jgi:hypothetical protein
MDADRLLAMAQNPRNIVGIFNYCDRWCERCLFTDRCFQYQTHPSMPELEGEEPPLERVFEDIARDLQVAFELLARRMAEIGLAMPSGEEGNAPNSDEEAREARARNDPVVRAAAAYRDLVRAWFDTERHSLLARAEDLVARADRADNGAALVEEAVQVKQALQIVEHDRWLIKPKLARAARSREWEAACPYPLSDPVQNDSNGSAKVALIAIDRSEAAWHRLAQWMDGSSTAAVVAATLARLRADVEAAFPQARQFVRPGFDDGGL